VVFRSASCDGLNLFFIWILTQTASWAWIAIIRINLRLFWKHFVHVPTFCENLFIFLRRLNCADDHAGDFLGQTFVFLAFNLARILHHIELSGRALVNSVHAECTVFKHDNHTPQRHAEHRASDLRWRGRWVNSRLCHTVRRIQQISRIVVKANYQRLWIICKLTIVPRKCFVNLFYVCSRNMVRVS
jgi:hypothetical protein